jgi:hypothetical protein
MNMARVGQLSALWNVAHDTNLTFNLVTVVACVSMLLAAVLSFFLLQTRPVYLVDFSVYRPPDRCGGFLRMLGAKRVREEKGQGGTEFARAAPPTPRLLRPPLPPPQLAVDPPVPRGADRELRQVHAQECGVPGQDPRTLRARRRDVPAAGAGGEAAGDVDVGRAVGV